MSKINKKYKQLIAAGKELFWKHGISRVTVEEIAQHAKVSKMTFYRHFDNKLHFAETVMKEILNKPMQEYEKLIDSDLTFNEKVKALFMLKFEYSKDISAELIHDIYQNKETGVMQIIEKSSQKSMHIFKRFLQKAQQEGNIRPQMKPEFVLYYLNYLQNMIEDENLLKMYETPQELIMELLNIFFYGLQPIKTENKD